MFHTKKDKNQMMSRRNYDRCRLHRWSKSSLKSLLPKPNPCCIAQNCQQKALISMWIQIRDFMCFKQDGSISTWNWKSQKLVCDVNMRLAKMWTNWQVINHIEIWSDKMKWDFFLAVAMSVLPYGWPIWTLMKIFEKKNRWGSIQEYYVLFWINSGSKAAI